MEADLHGILRLFGLRKYEADVYVGLLQGGMVTAQEVAEKVGVPSPRIYSIMKSLEKRGYVLKYEKSPARFRAANPGHILRAELSSLRRNVETVLLEAEQTYEMSLQTKGRSDHPATLTSGQKGFVAAEIGLLSSMEKELVGVVHDMDWCLDETILRLLKQKRRKKLNIRIVGGDSSESRENLDIFRASSGGLVRVIPLATLKVSFMIRDGSELLVLLSGTGLSNADGASALVVNNPEMTNMFLVAFDKIWQEAKELEGQTFGK